MRSSGENLLVIVNDILDISKIESGKLTMERLAFSLKHTVFEAARTQAHRAHAKDVELVVDIDGRLAEQYMGDPVRVGQVVSNLVGNAVKFTEKGHVVVRLQPIERGIRLLVSDTGVGISPDQLKNVFQAFTQAEGGTNRRFGGTGLGLSISEQLIRAMGGTIRVSSQVGAGSTFEVFLPLESSARGTPTLSVSRGAALVVGDFEASRAVTARMLEHLGFDVQACSASEAVAHVRQSRKSIQLVVLEHELQLTTGLELAQSLQSEASLRGVPQILTTRTTSRPSRAEVGEAGIRRVLARPVSLSELEHAALQLTPSPLASSSSQLGTNAQLLQRPLRVLLAEDNAINARLAQRLCEKLGHVVVHVTNGALAASAVEREPWDLVLMDMQMPVLDGLDATRRIRASESANGCRHVPIIALTASAMVGDEEVCLAAGMDGYLTKPLAPEALAAALHQVATREHQPRGDMEKVG